MAASFSNWAPKLGRHPGVPDVCGRWRRAVNLAVVAAGPAAGCVFGDSPSAWQSPEQAPAKGQSSYLQNQCSRAVQALGWRLRKYLGDNPNGLRQEPEYRLESGLLVSDEPATKRRAGFVVGEKLPVWRKARALFAATPEASRPPTASEVRI